MGGGATFAVDGGVLFSLSFSSNLPYDDRSLDDFDFVRIADRLVDDLDFLGLFPSCFSGDDGLGPLPLSLPTNDLRETELFVLLCRPKLLLSSSYTSIGFCGEARTLSRLRSFSLWCCPVWG